MQTPMQTPMPPERKILLPHYQKRELHRKKPHWKRRNELTLAIALNKPIAIATRSQNPRRRRQSRVDR